MKKLDMVSTQELQDEIKARQNNTVFVMSGFGDVLRVEKWSYKYTFKFSVKVLGFRCNAEFDISIADAIRLWHWFDLNIKQDMQDNPEVQKAIARLPGNQ